MAEWATYCNIGCGRSRQGCPYAWPVMARAFRWALKRDQAPSSRDVDPPRIVHCRAGGLVAPSTRIRPPKIFERIGHAPLEKFLGNFQCFSFSKLSHANAPDIAR
jgi:hypothetical protein